MDLIRSWPAIWVIAVLSGIGAVVTGCAQPTTEPASQAVPTLPDDLSLYKHVIEFDGDGHSVAPHNGKRLNSADLRQQREQILREMDKFLATKKHPKILIFVHGGLVDPASAMEHAKFGLAHIGAADPDCYPLYVVWNSSLGASYGEHLFAVRQGRKDSDTIRWAPITSPVYFLCDMLVAIARAPTVWIQQRATDDDAITAAAASIDSYNKAPATQPGKPREYNEAWMQRRSNNNAVVFYWALQRRYYKAWWAAQAATHPATSDESGAMAISVGRDWSHPSDWYWRGTTYTLTMPTKMLFAPLIDGLGSPAWQDMNRRSMSVIEGASDFEMNSRTTAGDVETYIDSGTTGGLELFIQKLARQIIASPMRANIK